MNEPQAPCTASVCYLAVACTLRRSVQGRPRRARRAAAGSPPVFGPAHASTAHFSSAISNAQHESRGLGMAVAQGVPAVWVSHPSSPFPAAHRHTPHLHTVPDPCSSSNSRPAAPKAAGSVDIGATMSLAQCSLSRPAAATIRRPAAAAAARGFASSQSAFAAAARPQLVAQQQQPVAGAGPSWRIAPGERVGGAARPASDKPLGRRKPNYASARRIAARPALGLDPALWTMRPNRRRPPGPP